MSTVLNFIFIKMCSHVLHVEEQVYLVVAKKVKRMSSNL